MNGNWFPWAEGVNGNSPASTSPPGATSTTSSPRSAPTNVTWVWCPNVDPTGKLTPPGRLYPGDAYVDWTCLDGYNWGKRADSPAGRVRPDLPRDLQAGRQKIAPSKPMIIGEVASNEMAATSRPGSRTCSKLPRSRKVRGLIWFDVNDRGTNWPIETPAEEVRSLPRRIRHRAYRPQRSAPSKPDPRPA